MNLKALKTVVTSKVGRQTLIAQKHSPVLLFGAGVVGMVATVVLASRATLKLNDTLEDIEDDRAKSKNLYEVDPDAYPEHDYKHDQMVLYMRSVTKVAKLYALPAALGVASIAALTGSHIVLTKRNVALTAAYAAIEKGYREYRQRVVDELGPEKDREFHHGDSKLQVSEVKADGTVTSKTVNVPDGLSPYARFFDESSQNWSRETSYNQLFLQCQQNYANDLLRSRGHVFLNEVYDMLGLERSPAGQIVGWVKGKGDDFVDFGVFEGDMYMGQRFVNGEEKSVRLDFNVAGNIYELI